MQPKKEESNKRYEIAISMKKIQTPTIFDEICSLLYFDSISIRIQIFLLIF